MKERNSGTSSVKYEGFSVRVFPLGLIVRGFFPRSKRARNHKDRPED